MRTRRRRDEGSALPMVLVLMVIGSLITLPLLDYTIAVFRANRVVSDRTAESEAAKGGLRLALSDPKNVFLTCEGGGNLTPSPNPTINGIAVQTSCSQVSEVGPTLATGFEVPAGAVAMQLGATVPNSLSGTRLESGPAYPYPATPDWWATPALPDPDAQYSTEPATDKIWMPHLPLRPPTLRDATPFDMPAAYDCKVFFPGRYDDPIDLSGRVYFTSGVYYFEEPVTIDEEADVVVGYGLADFIPQSDCADDLQVAANVLNPPSRFDINGGGATWVFGANGRLVVDNSNSGDMGSGARLRFNQRYADADRGGRVSIMTVNGDDVVAGPHTVTNVNSIPRSQVLDDTTPTPITSTGYQPSSSTYTDKARQPQPPDNLVANPAQQSGTDQDRGVLVVSWDAVTGQDAGGALLGEQDTNGDWLVSPYELEYRRGTNPFAPGCAPDDLLVTPDGGGGNTITCVLTGIRMSRDYDIRVRSVNEIDDSSWGSIVARVESSDPVVSVPDAPTNVSVVDGATDDTAQVSWDPPTNTGGVPITNYDVTIYKVAHVPHANVGPVAPPVGSEWLEVDLPLPASADRVVTAQLRPFDSNGDDMTLTIDTTALPAPDVTAVANDADDTVTVTVTKFAPLGGYTVPYTVTDPSGLSATGDLLISVVPTGVNTVQPPVADQLDLLADVDVPITARVPVSDEDGMPFAAVPVTVDTTGLDSDWAVSVSGLEVTIRTTAPDGTYSIPYTFASRFGATVDSTIDVTIARDVQPVDSCTAFGDAEQPMQHVCEVTGLPDLGGASPYGDVGYMTEVVAVNAEGSSVPAFGPEPWPTAFNGTGVGLLPPPPRLVTPWIPDAIIDLRLAGSASVEFAVAGYLAAPMGRLYLDNPNGFDVRINGGVMAGTFDGNDARDTGADGNLPIGFKEDIVLQRKVRIVSVAKNVTSTAVVEVNEDGAGYAVNTWVVG